MALAAAMAFALAGCSDDKDSTSEQRAALLALTESQIAMTALSDTPSGEFTSAKGRVVARVSQERLADARTFSLAAGRGSALIGDAKIGEARDKAAAALGTSIDSSKVVDSTTAERALAALLLEIQRISPAATTCEQLGGSKAENCAIALIIIEVKRCERTTVAVDASVPPPPPGDGGVTPVDSSVPPVDGSSPDAGPLGPVTTIQCGARDFAGAREITGTLSASENWSGKVVLKGSIYAGAITINIAPGTEIFAEADTALNLGWSNAASTIVADGTAAAPIRFCGRVAEAGFWHGITVGPNVTSDSILRNVLVAEAGGDGVAALDLDADVLVDNVQVVSAGAVGVTAVDFKAGSRALTVVGAKGAAVNLTGHGALTRFPLGGSVTNNADNTVHIAFTSLANDATMHNLGVPYVQDATLYHTAGELTVEAGVEFRVKAGQFLHIGWSNGDAALHANGTPTAPIRLRSANDTGSAWGGLTLGPKVRTTSNLTYADIRQAGSATEPAVSVESAVILENVTLTDNLGGLEIAAAGLDPKSKNLIITKTQGAPLKVHADALVTLPSGGTISENTPNRIELTSSDIGRSGTIPNLGVPYYVPTDVRLQAVTITFAPGTQFEMARATSITAGWSNASTGFVAEGTATSPIRFYGTDPAPGSWDGINLLSTVLSTSKLNYVEIVGAGSSATSAALQLDVALPASSVTNNLFSNSLGAGIRKDASNPNDYLPSNRFEMLGNENIISTR